MSFAAVMIGALRVKAADNTGSLQIGATRLKSTCVILACPGIEHLMTGSGYTDLKHPADA